MRRVYSRQELGMTKREISEIFNDRGAGDLLNILKDRFKPFDVSDKMKKNIENWQRKRNTKSFDRRALREISRIRKDYLNN